MRRLLGMELLLAAAGCVPTGADRVSGTTMPATPDQMAADMMPKPGTSATANAAPTTIQAPTIPVNAFETLKPDDDAHKELCANDGMHPNFPNDADRLTKVFCQDLVPGGRIPTPNGLADLLKLLGLDFKNPSGENGAGGNPGFALLAHSSALTARKVTPLTPTAFVFTPPVTSTTAPGGLAAPADFTFLAFDPGEQFVEVAVQDPTLKQLNLYLVLFEQGCNHTAAGCSTTDLLTPRLVSGWTKVRVYESSTFLNNTIADCRQCHAANGNSNPMILRMQEIIPPFTHWLSEKTQGGRSLLADFHAARGTKEDYGPIPAGLVDKSDPAKMAELITLAGFGSQPNEFDSAVIEAEVDASSPMQPAMNMPMGTSPTWQRIYDRAVEGQFILPPYHDVKISDPTKLAHMSEVYRQWAAGMSLEIPDIRDIFLDSALRDLGFAPKPGLDGYGVLVQMCQQCHNEALDPTITRDRFLVDRLDQMSRAEKDLAIDRLRLPTDTRLVMPPTLFRTITDEERQAMIAELKK